MALSIPTQAIHDAQAADSELWPVLLAIAGPESSWNPGAIGDNGTSYGYTQLHTPGGLGDGHSVAEMLDGVSNFRIAASYIRGRLAAGASLWDALSPWSARPEAWSLLQQIQGADQVIPIGSPTSEGENAEVALLAIAVLVVLAVA